MHHPTTIYQRILSIIETEGDLPVTPGFIAYEIHSTRDEAEEILDAMVGKSMLLYDFDEGGEITYRRNIAYQEEISENLTADSSKKSKKYAIFKKPGANSARDEGHGVVNDGRPGLLHLPRPNYSGDKSSKTNSPAAAWDGGGSDGSVGVAPGPARPYTGARAYTGAGPQQPRPTHAYPSAGPNVPPRPESAPPHHIFRPQAHPHAEAGPPHSGYYPGAPAPHDSHGLIGPDGCDGSVAGTAAMYPNAQPYRGQQAYPAGQPYAAEAPSYTSEAPPYASGAKRGRVSEYVEHHRRVREYYQRSREQMGYYPDPADQSYYPQSPHTQLVPVAQGPQLPVRARARKGRPVFAAILSLFFAGSGQFYNGEFGKGVAFFVAFLVLWSFSLGWMVQIWAAADAYQTGNNQRESLEP